MQGLEDLTFTEKMEILRYFYNIDTTSNTRPKQFWTVMDSIDDKTVIKWAEKVVKIKTPIVETWKTDDWLQLNNILHYIKNYNPMTQMPWSKAQKRFCTFMIIKFWDDIEMYYF